MHRWLGDIYAKIIEGYLCKDDLKIFMERWLEYIYEKISVLSTGWIKDAYKDYDLEFQGLVS